MTPHRQPTLAEEAHVTSTGIRLLTALVLTAGMAVVHAPSAGAHGQGPIEFTGTATLPEFPCPPPLPGQTACTGTFTGLASGTLSGLHLGEWTVTLVDATVTATFAYSDTQGNCGLGLAQGTVNITAGDGHAFGTYDSPNGPLPRAVTGLTATATFTWQRVGTAAQLALSAGTVQLVVTNQPNTTVMTGAVGQATAHFVPTFGATMPDCVGFVTRPPITASVAGVAALAQPGMN